MNRAEFWAVRKRIVSSVLATDMAKHKVELGKFQMMVDDKNFRLNPKNEEDKIFVMSIALHSSDISNPTKPWLF